MPGHLIRKLENFTRFSAGDQQVLQAACARPTRQFGPGETIVREGVEPQNVCLLLSGWAHRSKVLQDGRKQIFGLLLPGDFCDLKSAILGQTDHSITAVTSVLVSPIPHDVVDELTSGNGRIARALWWASLVAESIDREWIVNMGQRSASERLGHLFCEMFYRLRCIGMTDGTSFQQPLTQFQLSEATGMSVVHVNRSLRALRVAGLVAAHNKTFAIPNLPRLEEASLFSPSYLHLQREKRVAAS